MTDMELCPCGHVLSYHYKLVADSAAPGFFFSGEPGQVYRCPSKACDCAAASSSGQMFRLPRYGYGQKLIEAGRDL